jgi:APA family basic amino acid/polyamine antiporter
MARRLPGLERVLDVPSLAAVAYGEIGSSIFFALGIVALYGLGLTPWVLLGVGGLFFVVALAYAEGVAALAEPGGAAAFVRRAFNDPAGFATGWLLFLDYLIVIALAALFLPHYAAAAFGWETLKDGPWDAVTAIAVIAAIAVVRLVRRARLYTVAIVVAAIALAAEVLLIVLGFTQLVSTGDLTAATDVGTAPSWDSLFFSLALAALAYTGLETVANLGAEAREPGRSLPISIFTAIGAVVVVTTLVAVVGVAAYPFVPDEAAPDAVSSALASKWLDAPLVGIAAALEGRVADAVADALRVFVGITGVVVLVGAITTSISGIGRLAYALGTRAMLPHAFARLNERTLIAPASIVVSAALACVFLLAAVAHGDTAEFLASLYSFGILLAFSAAQLAVLRLRFAEPALERPFRVRGQIRVRGALVPIPVVVGLVLTAGLWIAAMATHEAARVLGPLWLAIGAGIYVAVRIQEREPLLGRVEPAPPDLHPAPEGAYRHILVPVKLGPLGDEVLATALRLAEEEGASITVLHVLRVPLELSFDAPLADQEERAREAIESARELAEEHGVAVRGRIIRARSIAEAIEEEARAADADLIILGSAPRWRRRSRFFSPTVDHVLRNADAHVMVIAYPEGVLEAAEAMYAPAQD